MAQQVPSAPSDQRGGAGRYVSWWVLLVFIAMWPAAIAALTPTPEPINTPTFTPTSCGAREPIVEPVTSPTDLDHQVIRARALLTFRHRLFFLPPGCTQPTPVPATIPFSGFEALCPLIRGVTNEITVCNRNELCGDQTCTRVDRNGDPLDIVALDITGTLTPTFTCTPTTTSTPTPTPTCAPTGTPYCMDHCSGGCQEIRPGCLAYPCGPCMENPHCAGGEVCISSDVFPSCCSCATVTPTKTPCPLLGSVSFHGLNVQPEHPVVGDHVALAFQVEVQVYSLSGYLLEGADPHLAGDQDPVRSGDTVTFVRTAASSGIANLQLIVNYVGERQCDSIFIPENASAASPLYQLLIDAPSPTTTATPTATSSPTASPTATSSIASTGGGCQTETSGGHDAILLIGVVLWLLRRARSSPSCSSV